MNSHRDTGLTKPYFIVDSDFHGRGGEMDESLLTTHYNLKDYSSAFLQFTHVFKFYDSEKADVEIRSSLTQGQWTLLKQYSNANSSGTEKIDISKYAAGASDVQVRFRYYEAEYDWFWALDDIYILGSKGYQCYAYAP